MLKRSLKRIYKKHTAHKEISCHEYDITTNGPNLIIDPIAFFFHPGVGDCVCPVIARKVYLSFVIGKSNYSRI